VYAGGTPTIGETMTDFFYDLIATNGVEFDSDAIANIAYNRENSELYVRFESGGTYVYSDVSESTYNLFATAPSLGHFYRNHISGEYTSHKGDYYLEPTETFAKAEVQSDTNASFKDLFQNPKTEVFNFGVKFGIVGTMIVAEPRFVANSEKDAVEQFAELAEKTLGADVEVNILAVTHYFD
jgi:hypothetical protein